MLNQYLELIISLSVITAIIITIVLAVFYYVDIEQEKEIKKISNPDLDITDNPQPASYTPQVPE